MSLINCNECGKEISDNARSCPNCGNPIEDNWAKLKLRIGIISIMFSLLIGGESSLIGIDNSLVKIVSNRAYFFKYGFICAFIMLCAGISNIATRKSSDKGGLISTVINHWIVTVVSVIFYIDYFKEFVSFLFLTVGIVEFCFGLVNLCSIFAKSEQNKKKQNLLFLFVNGIFTLSFFTILVNIVMFITLGC